MAQSKLLTALAVLLAAIACAGPGQQPSPRNLLGKAAPELKVDSWANSTGKALKLSDLKGKVVVLDFWAFW